MAPLVAYPLMTALRMPPAPGRIPELVAGDRLTREEFECRYEAMPQLKKAELVEGVVYVGSPVNHGRHGRPHALLCAWLVHYVARVPQVDCGIESTVRLDLDNEPQPDLILRLPERLGGHSRLGPSQYVEGAPELV